jgi:hypothetical protein
MATDSSVQLMTYLKGILEDQLGTYQYPNGFTGPAISIDGAGTQVKVAGIEVILPRFPDLDNVSFVGSGMHREKCWTLFIIQRSGNKLEEAVDRLTRFIPIGRGYYSPKNDVIGSFPQYRYKFKTFDLSTVPTIS